MRGRNTIGTAAHNSHMEQPVFSAKVLGRTATLEIESPINVFGPSDAASEESLGLEVLHQTLHCANEMKRKCSRAKVEGARS